MSPCVCVRCWRAGLELRDGGTEHSQLLGRFCRERPHTQETTNNVMYVKFFTDSRYPNNGFKAQVKIGVCGGTRFLGKTGSVELKSPDYPGHYRTNVDCVWSIQGPPGHYLSFTFVSLDLPHLQVESRVVRLKCNTITSVRTALEATICRSRRTM